MPTAILDGITTRYEVFGSGPPLLMYSPGGFDATVEKWRTQGIYKDIKFLDHLPEHYTCITFDRRETRPVRRARASGSAGPTTRGRARRCSTISASRGRI